MINTNTILYFSGSGKSDSVLRMLEQKGFTGVLSLVHSFEELESNLSSFSPRLILIEHLEHRELSEEMLKSICKMSKAPLVLLIDTATEDAAINLLQHGVEDIVFLDRPGRLLVLLQKLFKNAIFEGKAGASEKPDNEQESKISEIQQYLMLLQENYDLLFQFNPLPSWIFDHETLSIIEVNKAAIDHYGYSKEEFLGLTIKDLRKPEDVPDLLEYISGVQGMNQHMTSGSFEHLTKNGRKIRVEIYGYPLQYNNKNCSLVTCLDVTEKENAVEELKKKSEKLKTAQQIAKLGYWERNITEDALYWSDEVYKIWGRENGTFEPSVDKLMGSIHPDDLCQLQQKIDEASKSGENFDSEHRILLPNGELKWVHERGKLTKNSEGQPIFGGTVQDITDRKFFHEKLVLSEARNRGILQSQTNYLIRIDLDGRYSYCNDKFLMDFGWIFPNKEVIGQPASSSVKKEHHKKVNDIFKKCISKPNQIFQTEIEKLTPSGEAKTTLWDFICLTNMEGMPVEIQGVGIDITDRVQAENALRESNQRYELVSKAASDAIYDWNLETGCLSWNETYSELFGYSEEVLEIQIEDWADNLHPEDKQVFEDLQRTLKSRDSHWQAEYRYRKADGEYGYVNERGAIIRNSEGKAVRMVGAVQDITKSKLALQKLMRSEARHRGLIQSQTNFVIRVDLSGNYTYCNDKFAEEFGWIHGEKDLLGQSAMTSILEYHHVRVDEVVKLSMKHPGKVYQVELDKPGKNGKIRTTLWDITFLEAATPEESEVQCMGIDITDRVEAEKQMRFQADLLDKIGQAVIARDVEGRIRYWNNAATEIYGWKKEEALGQNINEILPSSGTVEEDKQVLQSLKKGITETREFSVISKSGTEFPIVDTDSPFFDENGTLQGIVSISSDISERKRNETELQNYTMELIAANKGLEQFSFIVSHNLRAPLANLLGIGNLLEEDDLASEVRERLMQELLNNIGRLDEVVKDLNTILRVKTELNENKARVDLYELVDSVKWSIDHIIKKEQVEIITDFTQLQEYVSVKSYLHSIFYNLISNSIKYKQPTKNPVIKISSQVENDRLFLIFEDNGLGIDLIKGSDQIFGLYKRFHYHVEGKGMGLFMVKTQVESLGGKISVESEQNKGSRFILEFKLDNTRTSNYEETPTVFVDRR